MLLRITLRAAAVAAIAFALCLLLAGGGTGRGYRLAALLPLAALACLAAAWGLHLRRDGFFRHPGRFRPRAEGLAAPTGPASQEAGAGAAGAAETTRSELGARRAAGARAGRSESPGWARALLLAGLALGLAAAALYALAGVGARYFG